MGKTKEWKRPKTVSSLLTHDSRMDGKWDLQAKYAQEAVQEVASFLHHLTHGGMLVHTRNV